MTDDGFFLAYEDFGGRFDNLFPACTLKKGRNHNTWRSSRAHSFHFSGQDQSTVAQRAETTVAEHYLTSCVSVRFPDRFPHCAWTALDSPLRLRWVKGICVFRCNLPSALLAEWPEFFTCHCSNTEMDRAPNKSQHTKLTLENKSLTPLLPGFELATFRARVRCSTNKLFRLPMLRKSTVHFSNRSYESRSRWRFEPVASALHIAYSLSYCVCVCNCFSLSYSVCVCV